MRTTTPMKHRQCTRCTGPTTILERMTSIQRQTKLMCDPCRKVLAKK